MMSSATVKEEISSDPCSSSSIPSADHQEPTPLPPKFLPSDVVAAVSTRLADLELLAIQVEDWIVLHRRRFDLRILEEPVYGAIQLLVHCLDGQYIHRVWGRTKAKGRVTSLDDLHGLCVDTFDQVVPCAGLFDGEPGQEESLHGEFVLAEFPFRRRVSRQCQLSYKVTLEEKPTVSELLGVGLCSMCSTMVVPPTSNWTSFNEEDANDYFMFERDEEMDASNHGSTTSSQGSEKKKTLNRQQRDERDKDYGYGTFASIVEQYAETKEDGSLVYKCPHCSHVVGAQRSLTRHLRMKHFFGDFECKRCVDAGQSYKARYLQDLSLHCSQLHPGLSVACPSCGNEHFALDQEEALTKHYFKCNRAAEYMIQKRRMERKPSIYYEKKHQCTVCGKKYLHEHILKDHMNTHTGSKPHKCSECNFASASSASLLHHRKIHLRERGLDKTEHDGLLYHFCDLCGNKYNSANYLQHHVRTFHQGILKKKQCDLCGKVFNNPTALRRHKGREHPSDPSLTCQVCGHVCADSYGFNNHAKVHKDPDLICRFCGKALKNKQSLEAHERSHTGENPFSCDLCDYRCKASSVLNKHKIAKHGLPSAKNFVLPKLETLLPP